jgi:hypothetical protein
MKIILLRTVICNVTLLGLCYTALGQNYKDIVSPSPTAGELGKYGESPISLYTGTPNTNISLCELKGLELTIPISLSYNASGITVEQNSSWVGLGWSLNAGGVITRSQRDKVDRDKPRAVLPLYLLLDPNTEVNTFNQLKDSDHLDFEPDVFNYNFMGHSGSFVFDIFGDPQFSEYNNWKVEHTYAAANSSFTITTDDGTKYEFTAEEKSGSLNIQFPNSWYLTKVTSATGLDVIDLQYIDEEYLYHRPWRYSTLFTPTGDPGSTYNNPITTAEYPNLPHVGSGYPRPTLEYPVVVVYGKRLTRINFAGVGDITFVPESNARTDVARAGALPTAYALAEIQMKDYQGALIKRFKINTETINTEVPHNYSVNTGPFCNNGAGLSDRKCYNLDKRLYLKSVEELPVSGTDTKNAYVFTYNGRTGNNTDLLPNKISAAQDHWGYFNNQLTNLALWPGYQGKFGTSDPKYLNSVISDSDASCQTDMGIRRADNVQIAGANRQPNAATIDYGTLKTIQYPTTGITEFKFEPHQYTRIGKSTETGIGGGVRIKEIINYDGANPVKRTEYTYADGVLNSKPQYYSYFFWSVRQFQNGSAGYTYEKSFWNNCGAFWYLGNSPEIEMDNRLYVEVSSGGLNDLGYRNGPTVGYTTVIEKNFTLDVNQNRVYNGSNEYTYSTQVNNPLDDDLYSLSMTYMAKASNSTNTTYPIFTRVIGNDNIWPYSPHRNIDWAFGQLLKKTSKNNSNVIIAEQENIYTNTELSRTNAAKTITLHSELDYLFLNFTFFTGWPKLTSQVDKSYDLAGGSEVITTKNFNYASLAHKYITGQSETNSDGKVLEKEMKYVEDYDNAAMSGNIGILKDAYILNKVIDERTKRGGKAVQGTITALNGIGQPTSIYNLETALPVIVDFNPGNIIPSSGPYNQRMVFTYHDDIRLRTVTQVGSLSTTYIWGYKGKLPVAEITNNDPSTVSTALTGLNLNFKSFYENTTDEFNIINKMNLLRDALAGTDADHPGSLIKSYTHKPSIGVSTVTDPSKLKSTFLYDTFQRLESIKDNNDKTVKRFNYNYARSSGSGTDPFGIILTGQLDARNAQIDLTWALNSSQGQSVNSSTIVAYEISRSTGNQPLQLWVTLPGNNTTKIDASYTPDQNVYNYSIRAILKDGTATAWQPLTLTLPTGCATNMQIVRKGLILASKPIADKACYEITLEEGFVTEDNAEYTGEIGNN